MSTLTIQSTTGADYSVDDARLTQAQLDGIQTHTAGGLVDADYLTTVISNFPQVFKFLGYDALPLPDSTNEPVEWKQVEESLDAIVQKALRDAAKTEQLQTKIFFTAGAAQAQIMMSEADQEKDTSYKAAESAYRSAAINGGTKIGGAGLQLGGAGLQAHSLHGSKQALSESETAGKAVNGHAATQKDLTARLDALPKARSTHEKAVTDLSEKKADLDNAGDAWKRDRDNPQKIQTLENAQQAHYAAEAKHAHAQNELVELEPSQTQLHDLNAKVAGLSHQSETARLESAHLNEVSRLRGQIGTAFGTITSSGGEVGGAGAQEESSKLAADAKYDGAQGQQATTTRELVLEAGRLARDAVHQALDGQKEAASSAVQAANTIYRNMA